MAILLLFCTPNIRFYDYLSNRLPLSPLFHCLFLTCFLSVCLSVYWTETILFCVVACCQIYHFLITSTFSCSISWCVQSVVKFTTEWDVIKYYYSHTTNRGRWGNWIQINTKFKLCTLQLLQFNSIIYSKITCKVMFNSIFSIAKKSLFNYCLFNSIQINLRRLDCTV